jgi:hypothetical protein
MFLCSHSQLNCRYFSSSLHPVVIVARKVCKLKTVKFKAIPLLHEESLMVQEFEAPRFQDNRHMKVVRLSAVRTGRLYLQEIFLELISVRVWVILRTILRPEELCQWKILMTSSGIEALTFWLVTHCLKQLRYRVQITNSIPAIITNRVH